MKRLTLSALLLIVFWTGVARAEDTYPQAAFTVRFTGMLLPANEQNREDLVTVSIFVEGTPWLLRLGEIKELTARDQGQAKEQAIQLRQVRFYGSDDLISQLQKPEIAGKVLTIEGRLDPGTKRFLVTAVQEGKGGASQPPPSK
ncbi:MAG: hypothetical protein HY268_25520 [Deltaproteobacteria bacterium]|nr:hypothetical protein [Deltaproteobacteria bacterium]